MPKPKAKTKKSKVRTIKVSTFKIFPGHKKHKDWYYKVYIFGSKKVMHEFRKELQVSDKATKLKRFNFEAIVSSYDSKHKENSKQYGTILFYKNSSSKSGIVSHELVHAAVYWWKYMIKTKWSNIPKKSKADEEFAHLVGSLVRQYWDQWWFLKEKLSPLSKSSKAK